MNFIKQQFSEREHLAVLTAEFAPTVKNKPASNYFLEQGFWPASEGAGMFYVLNKNDVDVKPCDWIKTKGASLWKTQKEYG